MSARVEAELGYVLHQRPYRDTSAIIDVFTRDHGRVSLVAKGFRNAVKSRQRWRADLQVGNLLVLSWSGRGDLKTLIDAQLETRFPLKGDALYCAFYVNELLQRLLHPYDSQADVFTLYGRCLLGLSVEAQAEPVLRRFEFSLLEVLGYGVDFSVLEDWPDSPVGFDPERGFVSADVVDAHQPLFALDTLRRVAQGHDDKMSLKVAKQLVRYAMAPLLGDRPLNSRKLFMQAKAQRPS